MEDLQGQSEDLRSSTSSLMSGNNSPEAPIPLPATPEVRRRSSMVQRISTRQRPVHRTSSLDKETMNFLLTVPELTEDEVLARYTIGELLGEGASGCVQVMTDKATGLNYAGKKIDSSVVSHKPTILREVEILRSLEHPNIIGFKEVIFTESHVYIIQELAEGGDLFERLCAQNEYNERDAKKITVCVLKALVFLHSKGIAHRDLKPENLMFTSEDVGSLKLVDFGLAKKMGESNTLSTAGTLGYKAPETLLGSGMSTQVDMWSLGVITYILLAGFPPFASDPSLYTEPSALLNRPFWAFFNQDTPQLRQSIIMGEFTFPGGSDGVPTFFDKVSADAKDFISALLQVSPSKRLTATAALEHPWISQKLPKALPALAVPERISKDFRNRQDRLRMSLKKRPTPDELIAKGILETSPMKVSSALASRVHSLQRLRARDNIDANLRRRSVDKPDLAPAEVKPTPTRLRVTQSMAELTLPPDEDGAPEQSLETVLANLRKHKSHDPPLPF